jgi:predicted ATP-grasp superfamily ATP-dependent carboligase
VTRLLIAGVSTRAAAESAARAGFTVTAVDAFGDLDQHPSVRALSLPRDFGARFTATRAARAARTIACDAVAYLSSFENRPTAVGVLGSGRRLWGNPPAVLRGVRDPLLLMRGLRKRGCATPDVSTARRPDPASADDGRRWLVKPLASGGGHGIRQWRGGPVPRGRYLQEFVDGMPGSVMFVAAEGRAVPLGISRQLVGEHAFGAREYRYCGNILTSIAGAPADRRAALVDRACALAHAAATEFGIVGVNGIDFVASDDVPYAIELNPRWSASMELVELAFGFSVFGTHAAACDRGVLPDFDLLRAQSRTATIGKAVIFARNEIVVGDTRGWVENSGATGVAPIRDVPHPGERILAGRPVCTVFAAGGTESACYAALVAQAERVYAELAAWERSAA